MKEIRVDQELIGELQSAVTTLKTQRPVPRRPGDRRPGTNKLVRVDKAAAIAQTLEAAARRLTAAVQNAERPLPLPDEKELANEAREAESDRRNEDAIRRMER